MKPTQVSELFANIKKTFVSFFSIFMFVALGVGIFLGISWAGPALQGAAEKVFDEGAFHNFQIQYPYGLTDENLAELAKVEGVSDVEGARQSIQTASVDSNDLTFKVQAIGERINRPIVVEGELPAKPNEIALNASDVAELGIGVGDTVTFEKDLEDSAGDQRPELAESSDANAGDGSEEGEGNAAADAAESGSDSGSDPDGMKYLKGDAYTVTALVESAEYISKSLGTHGISGKGAGTVHVLAWVVPEAFDSAAYRDAYPVANIRCESLAGLGTFTDEYKDASAQIEARISELGAKLSEARYVELHEDAQRQIDDGEARLADARKKLADGEKQLNQANKEIADGEKKIEEGEAELKDGKTKIAEGQKQLAEGRSQLESMSAAAKKKLDAARAKLSSARSEYNTNESAFKEAEQELDNAKSQYSSAQAEVEAAQANYDQAVANLKQYKQSQKASGTTSGNDSDEGSSEAADEQKKERDRLATLQAEVDSASARLEAAKAVTIKVQGSNYSLKEASEGIALAESKLPEAKEKLASAKKKLDAGQKKYDQAQSKYNSEVSAGNARISEGEAQLAEVQEKVEQGKKDLKEAKAKVKEGKKEVAKRTKELEDAKAQLEEKNQQLADAKFDLDQMKDTTWAVSPRAYNSGSAQVSTLGSIMNNLSLSMAALFIIVGLLVSYSAVSRIVHEQIIQIGTKKALGLRKREITASFLAYSAIAVVLGAIVGTIVGVIAVEGIIGHVLGGMFVFGDYPPHFGLLLFLGISAIEVALVLGATWAACHGILKEHAIELLKGEKPPEGKPRFYEKWGIWDNLPLFTQTIVNNCVNDKRRVFSTIVGVAGCTALIVTALTLNDNVLGSYSRHYEDVYDFDAVVYADTSVDNAMENIQSALDRQALDAAVPVFRQTLAIDQPNGERGAVRVYVPADEDAFYGIYHVKPISGETFDPQAEGVWVSQAYANHIGAKAGDEMTVDTGDGTKHAVTILGFYDFWIVHNEMLMNSAYYKKVFGASAEPNEFLVSSGGVGVEALESALSQTEGFSAVVDDKGDEWQNFETFSKVSTTVVLIYIALSVLMAIVVLLNLNVMFIEEKKRELIVLMINGFSTKDAKRYIYNDTIVLTALGIIAGLLLGCVIGSLTVWSVEPITATFLKDIDPIALIAGIVGSAVLAFAMVSISLRRIPKFNLTDINKA